MSLNKENRDFIDSGNGKIHNCFSGEHGRRKMEEHRGEDHMAMWKNQDLDYKDFQDFYDAGAGFKRAMENSIGPSEAYIWNISLYNKLLGEPLRSPEKLDDKKLDDKELREKFEASVSGQIELCPGWVNKSLWRQALLNHMHGLFQVREGIWQVRGYDLANMTIVEMPDPPGESGGEKGIVIIDCTTNKETASAALDLYKEERGDFRIVAVIFTHSHVDHYGGIRGVLAKTEANVPIIAPEHFLEEAALENAIAGDAMARRSTYQYGTMLQVETRDGGYNAAGTGAEPVVLATGKVDAGLGKDIQKGGAVGFAAPGISVVANPDGRKNEEEIYGVTVLYEEAMTEIERLHFEFLLCPGTEAPAEMTVWIEEYHTLVAAEIATHTLHNLLTPRGAEVRDARLWWKALDRLICRYGEKMSCICATHHWSMAESDGGVTGRIVRYLEQQRNSYKFLHDQTVRLMNQGYTMPEIAGWFADEKHLPDFMKKQWHNRGYYGTVSHDVRAIYQKYLGWYDMNPSNLNPLPPEDAAKRYITAIGEANAYRILNETLQYPIDDGQEENYRFAAEIGRHLVLSGGGMNEQDSASDTLVTIQQYRKALADIYRALAGRCEAGTWRNMYLVGAQELEDGKPLNQPQISAVSKDILNAMEDELFYDYIASRFNAEEAMRQEALGSMKQKYYITDSENRKTMELIGSGGVLNYRRCDKGAGEGGIGFMMSREVIGQVITGNMSIYSAMHDKNTEINMDDMNDVELLFHLFDVTLPDFAIVLPKG